MRRQRPLLRQLFPAFLAITVFVLLVTIWGVGRVYRINSLEKTRDSLRIECHYIKTLISETNTFHDTETLQRQCEYLSRGTGRGIVVTRPNGDILVNTSRQSQPTLSVVGLPEFQMARDNPEGVGVDRRELPDQHSLVMFYMERIVSSSRTVGYVGVSSVVDRSDTHMHGIFSNILYIALLIALAAGGMSFLVAWQINRPIGQMTEMANKLSKGKLHSWSMNSTSIREFETLTQALRGMSEELHQRLLSETRQLKELEAMFGSMVDAVLVIDCNEVILRSNHAAAELFHSKRSEMSGRSILEVIRNTQLHQFIRKTLSRNTAQEEDIIIHDSEVRYLRATGTALVLDDTQVIGALIVLHDVTQLHKLERIRRDFVANVSHELKTPITAIKGFVETLMEGAVEDPETAIRFLRISLKHTNQLHAVIEDLLSLSRIEQETGNGVIALSSGRIDDVVQAAVATCMKKAVERNVRLTISGEKNIVTKMHTSLLQQALINLIDNAVKYGKSNSVVEVHVKLTEKTVMIEVHDQGPGIPSEHIPRLFERFYRVDKSRSRALGGSGLGLAIVKHIIQSHQGTVTVKSELHKGTTFTIMLNRQSL